VFGCVLCGLLCVLFLCLGVYCVVCCVCLCFYVDKVYIGVCMCVL
jgi:hypothetical protein